MSRLIIKIKDKYLEWSTTVDAPTTYGMSLEEFQLYVKEECGDRGLEGLQLRLDRVNEHGHSGFTVSLADLIDGNHAGENGSELTIDEIYQKYCMHRPKMTLITHENGVVEFIDS